MPAPAVAKLGRFTAVGTLIAEGDSWFDYPLNDVLSILDDEHGYDVESVAHKGDPVEDMAYAPGQLLDFSRRLEKLLIRGTVPRAILLSGGGNDIAGTEFGVAQPRSFANRRTQRRRRDRRDRQAREDRLCHYHLGRQRDLAAASRSPLPILIHGYAFPVPDGRGFIGGFGPLPGPWLEPGFREKGFSDLRRNTAIMHTLIDRSNGMLQ